GDSTDGAENHRIGGVGAVRIHAVELVTRATIPKVAEVERGVDVRRRVAARHSTHVGPADVEGGVERSTIAHIGRWRAEADLHEAAKENALRPADIVRVAHDCRGPVVHIAQQVEREVGGDKRRIRTFGERRVVGIHAVLEAGIRSSVEVAARARLYAVSAGLLVPEQRLAQSDCRRSIFDIVREVRRIRRSLPREGELRRGSYINSTLTWTRITTDRNGAAEQRAVTQSSARDQYPHRRPSLSSIHSHPS